MRLKTLNEVIWRFYQEGRVKATGQTFRENDIAQFSRACMGEIMRQRFYTNKQEGEGSDSYYFSGDLSIKEHKLGEPDTNGKRRADMDKDEEVIRLPHSQEIDSFLPVGEGCGIAIGEIVQLEPGEERFFMGPDFATFMFFIQAGRGYDVYHVDPCVGKVAVRRIRIDDAMDVSFDLAFEIAQQVLGINLRIPGFVDKTVDNSYQAPQQNLKRSLQEQQSQGV